PRTSPLSLHDALPIYALPSLMERRVDGILLAAPQMEEDRAVARALDKTVPVVSLHHIAGGGVATVGSDDELTGLLATRHLVAKGDRKSTRLNSSHVKI